MLTLSVRPTWPVPLMDGVVMTETAAVTVSGTSTDVPVSGTLTVSTRVPAGVPSGIVTVTAARPTSSVVSTIVGSIAVDPSCVSPALTTAVPAFGSPLLNSSDERLRVTESPAE